MHKGRFTDVRPVQPQNAQFPTDVHEGTSMDVRLLHP